MPPQPKYSFTWDVQTVLDYIDGLGDSCGLDLKTMSKKTATLVALSTGCRGSEIASMGLGLVKKGAGKIKVGLMGLSKTSKPGQRKVLCLPFLQNKRTCPAATLAAYIQRTENRRAEAQQGLVFISFIKPY